MQSSFSAFSSCIQMEKKGVGHLVHVVTDYNQQNAKRQPLLKNTVLNQCLWFVCFELL